MKIPYNVKSSKLVNLIRNELKDFNSEIEITLEDIDKEGYSGQFEIEVGVDDVNFEALDYENPDVTRFPARIKASATSLKLLNIMGRFRISHKNGVLNIKKLLRNLNLHEVYSREDIHSVFSPDTIFSQGAGTWGNHGIIPIPNRDNDFVFIVTYGQKIGGHTFDEGITSDGVLSWQSQPSNKLTDKRIQTVINY